MLVHHLQHNIQRDDLVVEVMYKASDPHLVWRNVKGHLMRFCYLLTIAYASSYYLIIY